MKLVHYSRHEGLKNIDPAHQGTGVDAYTKGRDLENKVAFFYPEQHEAEPVVLGQSKSKYTAKLSPEHKVYDAHQDPENHAKAVKEEHGAFNFDRFLSRVKDSGYHGIKVEHPFPMVAMMHPVDVHQEEPVQPPAMKKSEDKSITKSMKRVALAYIVDDKDRLLMGRRNDSGKWTTPGGHVENGECPMAALAREVQEETGLEASSFKLAQCVYRKDRGILLYIFKVEVSGNVDTSGDPDNECDDWHYVDPIDVIDHLHMPMPHNSIIKLWFQS
jgi:8-oxo-dGTP pyrophosphatase MutT (NUDIX family)